MVGVRLAALGIVALVAAIVLGEARSSRCLVLLGGAYAVHLSLDDTALDARAPVLAAGLLLVAELRVLGDRGAAERTRGRQLRHLGRVAMLALGDIATGSVLLAVADVVETRGLAVDLIGAAAAACSSSCCSRGALT